jgi:RHS repeat-associated protein
VLGILTKTRKNTSVVAADFRTEYAWDHRNRLTKVTIKENTGLTQDPSLMTVKKTVEYFYDMFNRWTMRDLDPDGATGSATHDIEQFMHDGEEMILHGVPNPANPTDPDWRWMMRGPEQDMVIFEARDVNRVYLGDHLNTIRDVVAHDGTGWNIVNHLTIDSFGRRIAETNGNLEVMIGLGGRPYDEVTGLQNHVNRWYSVDTGRWMSEDPIGFEGGDANLSRFVGNDVMVSVDPEGLQKKYIQILINEANMPANFRIDKVQANLRTILANGGVKASLIFIPTQIDYQNENYAGFYHGPERPLGYQYDKKDWASYFGVWNHHIGICAVNLLEFPLHYAIRETLGYVHYVRFFKGSGKTIAGIPMAAITGDGYRTAVDIEGLRHTKELLGRNPNWDIAYANMLAHEIFFLGMYDGADDIDPKNAGTIQNRQPSGSRLVNIEPIAEYLNDALDIE